MSTVVQATCPGCRNVLQFPREWLKTPLRCKHCGTVLKPRRPADPTQTPTPRKVPPPLPAVPVTTEAPPALPQDLTPEPTPSRQRGGNAFADLAEDEEPGPRRRRRRGGSWVAPLVVMLIFLGLGGGAVAYFWPQLRAALNGEPIPPVFAEGNGPSEGAGGNTATGPSTNTQTTQEGPVAAGSAYPRRALILSAHNYLYANLVNAGLPGQGRSLSGLAEYLNRGLRIPITQIAHLSDAAKKNARPPLKPVVEKTYTDFLTSCRPQDRILVFLIGHSAEIEEKVYYVPIEGELDKAETLIPMEWFLEQMAACPARQKVLVVDVNRDNPTYGRERPGSGPMSEKLEALLKNPPEGVQVWSACSKDGRSYETDEAPYGAFIDGLMTTLLPGERPEKGLQGVIQRHPDAFPLEALNEKVNRDLSERLKPEGMAQVAFVAGKEKEGGAPYDPGKALAREPVLAQVEGIGGPENVALIEGVLNDVRVPPIKASKFDNDINYTMLPPMNAGMAELQAGGEETKIREKIRLARATLWAVSSSDKIPADLRAQADAIRAELRVDLSVLRDGYPIPPNEAQFRVRVEDDERRVAVVLGALDEIYTELKDLEEDKEKETKRWQANYDFIVAHLENQIAYLYEYQSMLGQIRKELPIHDPKVHRGFKLASRPDLTGDRTGQKLARAANRSLTSLADSLKGTPWEFLAKREKLTNLGMEWKPSTTP